MEQGDWSREGGHEGFVMIMDYSSLYAGWVLVKVYQLVVSWLPFLNCVKSSEESPQVCDRKGILC